MPLVLDWLPPPTDAHALTDRSQPLRFTTIGNWAQPGEVEWNGEIYTSSKQLHFLRYLDLPRRVGQQLELALGSVDADSIRLLESHGWSVVDPAPFGADILQFRDYILQSDAEFTVAKDAYVRLRTGWFSDRSAYYLATGKPVITQNTAFGRFLPTGEGLFSFDTLEEILDAFGHIRSDYRRHSQAARAIAEEHFRAETVLARLVEGLAS
jgi:hypothetical protein